MCDKNAKLKITKIPFSNDSLQVQMKDVKRSLQISGRTNTAKSGKSSFLVG
jgi:hypothetical protein